MGIELRIESDLKKAIRFLDEMSLKALPNAVRSALNETIVGARTDSNRAIRNVRRIKASEINKMYLRVKKAKGIDIAMMSAKLDVSKKPLSLIRFIIGPNTPRNQKGVAVQRRKPLRVHVRPGRRVQLKGAFIATGRGGKNQIFRRRTKSRFPIVKQSIPPLSTLFNRGEFRTPLEALIVARFMKAIRRQVERQLMKLRF